MRKSTTLLQKNVDERYDYMNRHGKVLLFTSRAIMVLTILFFMASGVMVSDINIGIFWSATFILAFSMIELCRKKTWCALQHWENCRIGWVRNDCDWARRQCSETSLTMLEHRIKTAETVGWLIVAIRTVLLACYAIIIATHQGMFTAISTTDIESFFQLLNDKSFLVGIYCGAIGIVHYCILYWFYYIDIALVAGIESIRNE